MMVSAGVITAIGYVAATGTTVSFVPQLVRVLKLRSARDISLGMFLIFSVGTFLWIVYGYLQGSMPVLIANIVTFALSMTILMLKLRFDRHATDETQADGAPR